MPGMRFSLGRVLCLLASVAVLPLFGQGLPKDDLSFLRDMTRDVVEASRVPTGSNGGGRWPLTNPGGFALITPGKDTYTAYWMRDFSWRWIRDSSPPRSCATTCC